MAERPLTITWLGHATVVVDTPGGKRLLLDPWVEGNPAFPAEWAAQLDGIDLILLSHGHFDHVNDVVSIAQATGAQVGGIFEVAAWLGQRGLAQDKLAGFNKGGTADLAGLKVTMTDARHSSAMVEEDRIIYLGEACGFVVEFENSYRVYFTGDTSVHSDMRLIGELYKPDLVVLPIGDFYTMGPFQAAHALKLIGAPQAIPIHYGTFPILSGTPEQLRAELDANGTAAEVIALKPGESWQA
ncbi:MAG TPA: metal-dependent hydrolase [Herpetosiphonaceae bacterium]